MNLTSRFQSILHSHPTKKILGYKENKQWKWVTRNELKNKVLYCVDVLKTNNVTTRDRIMYKGNNSVNWVAWSIATNSLGGVFVPLYNNQSDDYVKHIIEDCDPKLFVTNDTNHKKVNLLKDVINNNNYNTLIPNNKDNDVAKLIYTSGTTGKPKGVMLTHENILHNIQNIEKMFHDLQNEKEYTTLNILSWAHIYGLTTELYYNLLNNNKVALSSGPQDFIKEIKEIQPDLLYMVPRILQLIKSKLQILNKPIIKLVLPFILKRIFGKNLITIFIGGSQLDESTKNFYIENDINICEGYGCTETSPMVSVNHIYEPRNTDSVGKILDDLVVKVIDDEICVAGPSIMKGYYNDDNATKRAFIEKDGYSFYRTGDEGYVENGFLFYQGRISENYKLNNGKFVNVGDVENIVKQHFNEPCMVYGNSKYYNILITEKHVNNETMQRINNDLDSYLHIKKVLVLEKGTFQKHLTPKMSLKRKDVEAQYYEKIKEIYLE